MADDFVVNVAAGLVAGLLLMLGVAVLRQAKQVPGWVEAQLVAWLLRVTMRGVRHERWSEILQADLEAAETLRERWTIVVAALRVGANPAAPFTGPELVPVTRTGRTAKITHVASFDSSRDGRPTRELRVSFDDGTTATAVFWARDFRIIYERGGTTIASQSPYFRAIQAAVENEDLARLIAETVQTFEWDEDGVIRVWKRT